MNERKVWLTITEAAALLGVSYQTVNNMLSRGELQRYKRERNTFLSAAEVERVKKQRQQQPVAVAQGEAVPA